MWWTESGSDDDGEETKVRSGLVSDRCVVNFSLVKGHTYLSVGKGLVFGGSRRVMKILVLGILNKFRTD